MRIRNIKPGLFKNEILGDAELSHTVLFIGLWCLADRKGRLEDRPLRIRNELFPQRDINVDAGLDFLAKAGFITRYEFEGTKYIQILAFEKHQHIHSNEAPSTIPAPSITGNYSTSAEIPSDSLIDGKMERWKDGKTDTPSAIPPPNLDTGAWEKFVTYRKKIKKPIRPVSYELAMKELAGFGDAETQQAVVSQSIAKGWQGLFELKRAIPARQVRAEDLK